MARTRAKKARARGARRSFPANGSVHPLRRPAAEVFTPAPAAAAPALEWDLADVMLVAGAVICALALYVWRLNVPRGYVFDEVYHAFTAVQLVAGNRDAFNPFATPPPNVAYEWTHPALSKLIIETGIRLFGANAIGWRSMSALFGALGVGLLYAMGRLMFNRTVALFAVALALMDGLWYTLSRIAMNDIFLTTFIMLAYLGFFFYLREPLPRARRWLWLTGAGLGLGFASKWSAGYSFAILAALAALREGYWYLIGRKGGWLSPIAVALGAFVASTLLLFWWQGYGMLWCAAYGGVLTAVLIAVLEACDTLFGRKKTGAGPAVTWVGAFVALPALIYLAAYAQYFTMGWNWSSFVELQRQMYYYHSHLTASHAWGSRWWTWPLVLKPVWLYVDYRPNNVADIFALGNPLIWWAFVPAIGFGAYVWYRSGPPIARALLRWRPEIIFELCDWVRSRSAASGLSLVLIGFLGQWLPWALSPRISFLYHMLPSVPFGFLAIAYGLFRLRAPRLAAVAYLLPVLVAFLYFFPIYSAWPLSRAATDQRYWVSGWKPR